MALHPWRIATAAMVLLFGTVCVPHAGAADSGRPRNTPALFSNYYVPPGPYGGVGAQLYVSPRPTPPLVGHTYVTYQPLMPHQFLYHHHQDYIARHGQGTRTRTHVTYRSFRIPTVFAAGVNLLPILPH